MSISTGFSLSLILGLYLNLFLSPLAFANNHNKCSKALTQSQITKSIESNTIPFDIFYPQTENTPYSSYNQLIRDYKKLSSDEVSTKRKILKQEAMYTVEPVPVVIKHEVWTLIKTASEQRTRAAIAFLNDVYSSSNAKIYQKYPELKHIVESSSFFAEEVVGAQFVKEVGFDIALAMDIVVVQNKDGSFALKTLESDSGNIGGNMRMPSLFNGLTMAWPALSTKLDLTQDFLDTRESVIQRIKRHADVAAKKGGFSLMFTEFEDGYAQHDKTWIREEFEKHKVLVSSHWGVENLRFDEVKKIYFYKESGKEYPITDFWLEHYSHAFDPRTPSYQKIASYTKTDEFLISHQIPGFWQNYINGGYKNWAQLNALGGEVFCDKAVSSYLPKMVEFYLNESPILNDNPYQIALKATPKATDEFINKVFNNREQYVVKSRTESGQGKGVYVGAFLGEGKTKNGLTWEQLKLEVQKNPLEWIIQSFFKDKTLPLLDNRERSFEMRTITNSNEGTPYLLDAIYIRSSKAGTVRNMSGNKDRVDLDAPSIIPVLIPRE